MMHIPVTSPVYSELTQAVPTLQMLQSFLEHPRTATLAEVIDLLASMQQEYGEAATLEQIIQHRVALQFQAQREAQKARRLLEVAQ